MRNKEKSGNSSREAEKLEKQKSREKQGKAGKSRKAEAKKQRGRSKEAEKQKSGEAEAKNYISREAGNSRIAKSREAEKQRSRTQNGKQNKNKLPSFCIYWICLYLYVYSHVCVYLHNNHNMEVSWNRATPKSSHFSGLLLYKPSSYWGYHHKLELWAADLFWCQPRRFRDFCWEPQWFS